MPDKEKKYLTQREVAELFRVSQSTIKNWRDSGLLDYFQPPGSSRVLYPKTSIEAFEKITPGKQKNGGRALGENKKGICCGAFRMRKAVENLTILEQNPAGSQERDGTSPGNEIWTYGLDNDINTLQLALPIGHAKCRLD